MDNKDNPERNAPLKPNEEESCPSSQSNGNSVPVADHVPPPAPQSQSINSREDEDNKENPEMVPNRSEVQAVNNTPPGTPSLNQQLVEARQFAAVKRKLKIEEEVEEARKKREKMETEPCNNNEEVRSWQPWQDLQQAQALKKQREQKKKEEEQLRKRVLQQIADDRAERNRVSNAAIAGVEKGKAESAASTAVSPISSDLQLAGNVRVQFIMPDGRRLRQSFQETQTLGNVREHLFGLVDAYRDFTISTTYPLREFTDDDNDKTLSELGFVPSVVLAVRYERMDDSDFSDDENDQQQPIQPRLHNGANWYGFESEEFENDSGSGESIAETEEMETEDSAEETEQDEEFQSDDELEEQEESETDSEYEESEEEGSRSEGDSLETLSDEDIPQELLDLKKDQEENNENASSDSEASPCVDVENLAEEDEEDALSGYEENALSGDEENAFSGDDENASADEKNNLRGDEENASGDEEYATGYEEDATEDEEYATEDEEYATENEENALSEDEENASDDEENASGDEENASGDEEEEMTDDSNVQDQDSGGEHSSENNSPEKLDTNAVGDSSFDSEVSSIETENEEIDQEFSSDSDDEMSASNWRNHFYDTESDDEGDPDFANYNHNCN